MEISDRKEEIAASGRCCNPGFYQGCGAVPGGMGLQPDTLYIGGGTPSVLPVDGLRRIADAIASCQGKSENIFQEFTVEVNPDDIVSRGPGYVESLRRIGVNRVSMGVQSMDDNVLKWMNRRHSVQTARQAYRTIRSAGIENISIDLIFGYDCPSVFKGGNAAGVSSLDRPGASGLLLEHWKRTIEDALDIAGDGTLPKHISAYQLSVDRGSMLAELAEAGKYAGLPDEICAGQYEILCSMLSGAGYHHYEISNFALPGHEAVHNSAYWSYVPYTGLGPAAHSMVMSSGYRGHCGTPAGIEGCSPEGGNGIMRCWNVEDVGAYIRAAESGERDGIVSGETLTQEQIRTERIMLSLRTDRGIDRKFLEAVPSSGRAVEKLLRSGSLSNVDAGTLQLYGLPSGSPRLRIPEDRFFVSDDIISELL